MRVPFVCVLVFGSAVSAQDYPKVELKSPTLKMTIYPPDAEKGFYRGSRFCWGGVMGDMEIHGLKLFHAWKDRHDPRNNDDILGPVLEFGQDMPLGYDDAKPGEHFVKVGVGELVKPDEKKYHFATNYKVANPGLWKIKSEGTRFEFRQTLRSKTGYEYHLAMIVHLFDTKESTQLYCKYELVNIGTKAIHTDVYNHNFFNVNKATVGPGYALVFGGEVEASAASQFGEKAVVKRDTLNFPQPLTKGQAYGQLVSSKDKQPIGTEYTMQYAKDQTLVKVCVRDEWPGWVKRKKFTVWSIGTCLCPEPFYPVDVEPGESLSWTSIYEIVVKK
jgi:hypothetical protein